MQWHTRLSRRYNKQSIVDYRHFLTFLTPPTGAFTSISRLATVCSRAATLPLRSIGSPSPPTSPSPAVTESELGGRGRGRGHRRQNSELNLG